MKVNISLQCRDIDLFDYTELLSFEYFDLELTVIKIFEYMGKVIWRYLLINTKNMRTINIEIYNIEEKTPNHGEIVHVISRYPVCVYYNDHRKGFWYIDGTGEKATTVSEWYYPVNAI